VASHRAGNCSTCSFLFSFPIRFDHSTPRPNHPKKSPPSTQKKQKANKKQKKEKKKKKLVLPVYTWTPAVCLAQH
jgi:hypothetical protein